MAGRRFSNKKLNQEAIGIIELLKVKLDCKTDSDLADYLNVTSSNISRWKVAGLPKATKSLIFLLLNRENQVSVQIIERLKKRLSCQSDGELADALGLKESQVTGWRLKDFPKYVITILEKTLPPLKEEGYEDKFSSKPCVYFIQSMDTERIKIGFTRNLKKRMSKMQTDSSEQLKILFAFDPLPIEEKALHTAFASHRVHGEWFTPDSELLEFIEEQKLEEQFLN